MGPYVPFKGDKTYVIADLITLLIGVGIQFSMLPALTADAIKKAQEKSTGGPAPSESMMQGIMMGGMGCGFIVALAISILLWVNIIKGKKWAFIVSLIFIVIGLLMGMMGLAGPAAMAAIFGMVVGVAKLIYCVMRMAGKVGPAPI